MRIEKALMATFTLVIAYLWFTHFPQHLGEILLAFGATTFIVIGWARLFEMI
jgi:hypothetical protein